MPWYTISVLALTNVWTRSGGEEVMLDVGGQDATEAFEDVGHSDEARETLEQLLVGSLKRQVSLQHTQSHSIPPIPHRLDTHAHSFRYSDLTSIAI